MAVRQRSKHELVAALQGRYRRADRAGKARLVDEFCAATGLSPQARHPVASERPASATSGAWWSGLRLLVRCGRRVASVCWGQRLAVWQAIGAVSRQTGSSIGAEGALRLEPLAHSQLLVMSAATIDRRLQPIRLQLGSCQVGRVSAIRAG